MSEAVSTRALFTRFPQALWVGLAIIALLLHWWAAWPLPVVPYQTWIGAGLCVLAALWVAYAIWTLRRHETSPLPWEVSMALVTTGPYRFGRNPIYLGDVCLLIGLSLILGNTWMLIAAVVSVPLARVLVIRHEEAYMAERFGAAWLDYIERSRRWI